MSQIVYTPSACEEAVYIDGMANLPGNVEIDMLNVCGLLDGRPPVAAAAASFNGLEICRRGTTFLRLGIDAPCGSPFDVFRLAWRFKLDVDKFGVELPSVGQQVLFKVSYRPDLSGIVGERPGHVFWFDYTGLLPVGNPGQPGSSLPVMSSALLMTFAEGVLDLATGTFTIDVTAAYNQAKAEGRADMWIGAKIDDEFDDGVGTSRFYTIIGREHPDPAQWPRLEFTVPEPQTVNVSPAVVEFSTLEGCVSIGDQVVPDSPERTDMVPEAEGPRIVRRGNTVYIEVDLWDLLTWPGAPTDATSAAITIYEPDGTVLVNAAAMYRVAFSRYAYQHTTQNTDPLGYYTASFEITL